MAEVVLRTFKSSMEDLNMETLPTFEEFRAAVKNSFWEEWPQLDEKEVERFLNQEDILKEITNRYEEYKARFLAGKITRQIFMIGGVASVGMCLGLMY